MNKLSYIGLVVGLFALVVILVWYGLDDVIATLLTSGWGLLLLPIVWLPSLFMAILSWQLLFNDRSAPDIRKTAAAMWMGRAVNTLLPVATIGGEIVKARLLTLWGSRGTDASASVVVDKTVQVLAIILWGLIGVGLLLHLAVDNRLAAIVLAGFSVLGACVAGFIVVQRAGMFGHIVRFGGKVIKTDFWENMAQSAKTTDTVVSSLYRQPLRIASSVALRLLSLVLQTAEVWVAAQLLGQPIGITEALLIKSLTSTMSDVAFIIPNAYGVQEGGFVMIGALLGFQPDYMLAMSLAVRVRELVIDLPGLLAWQHAEGNRLLQRGQPTG